MSPPRRVFVVCAGSARLLPLYSCGDEERTNVREGEKSYSGLILPPHARAAAEAKSGSRNAVVRVVLVLVLRQQLPTHTHHHHCSWGSTRVVRVLYGREGHRIGTGGAFYFPLVFY